MKLPVSYFFLSLICRRRPRRPYCSFSLSTMSHYHQVCSAVQYIQFTVMLMLLNVASELHTHSLMPNISVCVCVLRGRGDILPLRMEGLCHHPLLFLHRHHPPRRGAGVSSGREYGHAAVASVGFTPALSARFTDLRDFTPSMEPEDARDTHPDVDDCRYIKTEK